MGKTNLRKTSKQEKANLDSKIRQLEYFMEGEHTATMRTANSYT